MGVIWPTPDPPTFKCLNLFQAFLFVTLTWPTYFHWFRQNYTEKYELTHFDPQIHLYVFLVVGLLLYDS